MKKEIDGWTLDDYEGDFSPDAQSKDSQVWLGYNQFRSEDIEITNYNEGSTNTYIPVQVMSDFMEMCRAWKDGKGK